MKLSVDGENKVSNESKDWFNGKTINRSDQTCMSLEIVRPDCRCLGKITTKFGIWKKGLQASAPVIECIKEGHKLLLM